MLTTRGYSTIFDLEEMRRDTLLVNLMSTCYKQRNYLFGE